MFFLLNKPSGVSSGKYIRNFAQTHQIKKIGHTGTLDPFATGLMLVATDDDTKLIPFLKTSPKTYEATVKWGQATTTYDCEGEVTNSSNFCPDEIFISKVLAEMTGFQMQTPPVYSAKQINGNRAYHLARKGQLVTLQPTEIKVYEAGLLNHDAGHKTSKIWFTVSTGTYIRSLVHSLGLKCQSYATTYELRRTILGYLKLQDVQKSPLEIARILPLPVKKLTVRDLQRLQHGQPLAGQIKTPTTLFYQTIPVGIAKVGTPIWAKPILVNRIQQILKSI